MSILLADLNTIEGAQLFVLLVIAVELLFIQIGVWRKDKEMP